MPSVTLKFVNPAAAGKKFGSVVDTNDERYPVAKGLIGRFEKGKTYEVTVEQQKWGDSVVNVITGIDSVRTPHPGDAPAGNGHSNGDKWFMPFVSNTVAHALTAGVLTDPTQIKAWAAAAKQAAEELV